MESDAEFCRDRTYSTRHVALPRRSELRPGLPPCWVDYARTTQLDELRNIMQQAALRGDNVGRNEFSDAFMGAFFFNASELFVVTSCDADVIVAFLAIHPCVYARSYDTCLASARVVRSQALASDDAAFRSLVRLAVEFTASMDTGYTHVMVDVAFCHVAQLRALRAEGFTAAAVIPVCVDIVGVGVVDNVLMVRQLGLPDRPPRSSATVLQMLERANPCTEFIAEYPTMTLPQVPFLPQTFSFSCGVRAIFRNLKKEEDHLLYSIMEDSAQLGQGHAINEFPSFDYFRKYLLAENYCVVLEEEPTKKLIGFITICTSWYLRGVEDHYESHVMVHQEFRGKGIASELMVLEVGIAKELGYQSSIHDAFLSNVRMLSASKHMERVVIGIIPHSGYVQGVGWEDLAITCSTFPFAKTFTELVKENGALSANKKLSKL